MPIKDNEYLCNKIL